MRPRHIDVTALACGISEQQQRDLDLDAERARRAAPEPAHNHTGPLGAGTCPVCNPAEPGDDDWDDFLDLARAFGG